MPPFHVVGFSWWLVFWWAGISFLVLSPHEICLIFACVLLFLINNISPFLIQEKNSLIFYIIIKGQDALMSFGYTTCFSTK